MMRVPLAVHGLCVHEACRVEVGVVVGVGCDLIDRLLSILTPRWSKEGRRRESGGERERILWNQSGNEDQGVVRSCEAPRAVL